MTIKLFDWCIVERKVSDSGEVLNEIGIVLCADNSNGEVLLYFPRRNDLHNYKNGTAFNTNGRHRWWVNIRAIRKL